MAQSRGEWEGATLRIGGSAAIASCWPRARDDIPPTRQATVNTATTLSGRIKGIPLYYVFIDLSSLKSLTWSVWPRLAYFPAHSSQEGLP